MFLPFFPALLSVYEPKFSQIHLHATFSVTTADTDSFNVYILPKENNITLTLKKQ